MKVMYANGVFPFINLHPKSCEVDWNSANLFRLCLETLLRWSKFDAYTDLLSGKKKFD
jgi:hypothetical protein